MQFYNFKVLLAT